MEPTRSRLVRLIYSFALHISLIKMPIWLSCSAFQPGLSPEPLGTDARHFVCCHQGLRLHGAVSDRVRGELAFIPERCRMRLIAECPGSRRQMTSCCLREGAFLLKTPDLVIPDLDGPRSFTLSDIKIMDPQLLPTKI